MIAVRHTYGFQGRSVSGSRRLTGGGPETFAHGNAYSRRIHFGLPSFKNG
jgi:hypothetical protein